MTLAIIMLRWFELSIATACLFSGIATRGKRLEQRTKRISQADADRFDVRKAIPLFTIARSGGENIRHGGVN
jgi:hypothetical protein